MIPAKSYEAILENMSRHFDISLLEYNREKYIVYYYVNLTWNFFYIFITLLGKFFYFLFFSSPYNCPGLTRSASTSLSRIKITTTIFFANRPPITSLSLSLALPPTNFLTHPNNPENHPISHARSRSPANLNKFFPAPATPQGTGPGQTFLPRRAGGRAQQVNLPELPIPS